MAASTQVCISRPNPLSHEAIDWNTPVGKLTGHLHDISAADYFSNMHLHQMSVGRGDMTHQPSANDRTVMTKMTGLQANQHESVDLLHPASMESFLKSTRANTETKSRPSASKPKAPLKDFQSAKHHVHYDYKVGVHLVSRL